MKITKEIVHKVLRAEANFLQEMYDTQLSVDDFSAEDYLAGVFEQLQLTDTE